MAIIRCPHCTKDVTLAENASAGQDVRCPSCRKLFKTPGGQPAAAAAPVARPAGGSGPAPKPAAASAQGAAPKPAPPSAQGTAPRPAAPAPPRPAPGKAGSLQATYKPLLEAVAFAARAHQHQKRKDDKTPYFSHVARVCLVVRHVFNIDDSSALMTAALHDTIEDTTTDWDDLDKHFGADVAGFVASLSKDKRRQEAKREEIYKTAVAKSPWQVQVCKLADIFDNLLDCGPDQRPKTIQRSREYLAALAPELHEQAKRPHELVSQLLAEIEKG